MAHYYRRTAKAAGIVIEKEPRAANEQNEPIKRTKTDRGTVKVTFGKGWNPSREKHSLPSMYGFQSSLNSVY